MTIVPFGRGRGSDPNLWEHGASALRFVFSLPNTRLISKYSGNINQTSAVVVTREAQSNDAATSLHSSDAGNILQSVCAVTLESVL